MSESFMGLLLAGFLAQLIDGALGMGFGIVGTTLMLAMGLPPAKASAMVHIAEVFTTGASGISHIVHKNIDWHYVRRLALAGAAGGALGAYALVQLDGEAIRPFVIGYLALMGLFILVRTFWQEAEAKPVRTGSLPALGFGGGFLDAIGGGGWGPIVTSTLVGRGHVPRYVIGSVNLTEFFVTLTISATFIASMGINDIQPVLGFIVGGLLAAPLAGLAVKIAPAKLMRAGVGFLVLTVCAVQSWRMVAG